MKLRFSKGEFLVGILSFIMAFIVCAPAVFAEDPPLCVAAKKGDLAEVKHLVSSGAKVNCKGSNNWTSLWYAILNTHFGIAEYLLENGANIDAKDDKDHTILLWVSWRLIYPTDSIGDSMYKRNIHKRNVEIMKFLIQKKANLNSADCFFEGAVTYGGEVAKYAIENGYLDINCYNGGFLQAALYSGNRDYELIQWLILHGAYVDANSDLEWSFLSRCYGDEDFLIWLAENHGNVCYKNKDVAFPLINAVLRGDVELVQKMLAMNTVDVNGTSLNGCTPLHAAAYEGKIDTAKVLLEHLKLNLSRNELKDYVNRRNKAGDSPIIAAKKEKHYDFVHMLLSGDYGAVDEDPSSCLVM